MKTARSYRFCVPLTLCSSLIAPNVEHIWKLYVFDNPWMSFFHRFRQMDSLSSCESAEHLQFRRMRYSSEPIALRPTYAGSLQRTVFTGKDFRSRSSAAPTVACPHCHPGLSGHISRFNYNSGKRHRRTFFRRCPSQASMQHICFT